MADTRALDHAHSLAHANDPAHFRLRFRIPAIALFLVHTHFPVVWVHDPKKKRYLSLVAHVVEMGAGKRMMSCAKVQSTGFGSERMKCSGRAPKSVKDMGHEHSDGQYTVAHGADVEGGTVTG